MNRILTCLTCFRKITTALFWFVELALSVSFLLTASLSMAEEYEFDLSEIEKKPYHIGGYGEFRPVLLGLDRNAALHNLKFYDRDEGDTLDEYNFELQLDGRYQKGISRFFVRLNSDLRKGYTGWSGKTSVYEGYLSIEPSSSLNFDAGKKALRWGKGYARNPVDFVGRPKDPYDPELNLEGFVMASADYIKSFDGPLKTFSFTPVLLPVYKDLNDDFGEEDGVNFATKLYFLYYDTDIDLMFLAGGSKASRVGVDFSRNISTNFEIHGEFAWIKDFKKSYIDENGQIFETESDVASYLIGLRYLNAVDTTFILEYYHNGTGFTRREMEDYFSFIRKGYEIYSSTGDDTLLKKATDLSKNQYGKMTPMRNYLYLRIIQKEPFDLLYFTPSIISMFNMDDQSFTLTPELLYTGITNLELRLRGALIAGKTFSEYGEKQNDYRIEFRVRYYF